jgi:heterodisulfide reductase subunit C
MNLALEKPDLDGSFRSQLDARSGARLGACLQCKKCSAGCPVARHSDLKPHEIVRLTQLGQRGELLSSKMIWQCTSCQTCATRCPQRVDVAALNDALRRMSREQKAVHGSTTLPIFNDAFLSSVRKRGRVWEVGLMATYKLRTLRLFEDMAKLPMMLAKGKLALFPSPSVPGGRERRQLWKRVRAARGRQP